MRVYGRLPALLLALVMLGAAAPAASALVVHKHRGHFFGVLLHRGVPPKSVQGATPAGRSASAAGRSGPGSVNSLVYQGGPVVHSSTPYLIFWTPPGHGQYLQAGWESSLTQYFTDTAATNGSSANVYGVLRQYPDDSGTPDYRQAFGNAQAITDPNPLPTLDASNCTSSPCVTDAQIQSEVASVIAADHLPTDGSGTGSLPDSAPIYFVVLPSDVNVCFSDGTGQCASNFFCAYHSNFSDGNQNVLYAAIPTFNLTRASDEKACQSDHNSAVQEPNHTAADVAIGFVSHEFSETLTDPLGTGWWDSNGDKNSNAEYGYEVGDKCGDYVTDPNAFLPVLGGSATPQSPATYGTLYTQLINGHQYYTQSEWSNGDSACQMAPSSGTVSAQFTAPSGTDLAKSALNFDPGGSTSTNPVSGATWDWGDGTSTFSSTLGPVSHAYATGGVYTVRLTVVDNRGNTSTATQTIDVYPIADYTYSPSSVIQGVATTFDGSSSSEPGGTIAGYSWDFGDRATATGAHPSHTYGSPGTYTVKLTVTDTAQRTSTSSQQVTVAKAIPPTISSFMIDPSAAPVGQQVSFSGSATDPQVAVTTYTWNFGDGQSETGSSATHNYGAPGVYTVSLTVGAANGTTTTETGQVTVGPVPAFVVNTGQPTADSAVAFDASGSNPAPGSSIAPSGYAWNFGDGETGTGPTPSHVYTHPSTYTVTLTVTNNLGQSQQTSHLVTVAPASPTAAFTATPSSVSAGQTVSFDGSASTDSDSSISSYSWNFGDGTTNSGASAAVTHAYSAAGVYSATLTVTDAYGATGHVSSVVTVLAPPAPGPGPGPAPKPPTAAISVGTTAPVAGAPVSFSGTGSSGSYRWSFGDGGTASGAGATHTYAHAGSYSVSLTVTDGAGQSAVAVRSITVAPAGRITRVVVRPARGGALVAVSVGSAGTLFSGRRVFRVARAGTVRFTVVLSRSQLHGLQVGHRLRLRLPLRFAPAVGPAASSTAVIVFRAARGGGRLTASLGR